MVFVAAVAQVVLVAAMDHVALVVLEHVEMAAIQIVVVDVL